MNETHNASRSDSRTLASSLAPVLMQACDGRLGEITWFKTDWQRGGAATGVSTWRLDDEEQPRKVIVKLPVVQRELLWTRRLQQSAATPDPVAPRLYASDETLGGYDFAWIVVERFEYGPLGTHWHDAHITRMAEAATRFHAIADGYEVDQPPRVEAWHDLIADAAQNVKVNHIARQQEWVNALKAMRHRLDKIVGDWESRDARHWLHGDLHLANAMSRIALDHGPVCLIDMAEVHVGHWIEDAVYLERQLWARPDRLKSHKPVKEMAAARKKAGLACNDEYPRLAMIRRALLAATAPKFIKSEGHPAYLEACLHWLETSLHDLK